MPINPGQEFNIRATPSQQLLRKLAYLATQDNDSVLTGGLKSIQNFGAGDNKTGRDDKFVEAVQFLSVQEQIHQDQMREFNERLDALDRASEQGLREARGRLDEIRRTANQTKDGRLAFEDEDGTIRDEQGNRIRPEDIDQDKWNPNSPTWEDYRTAQQQETQAQQYRDSVQQQRDRLERGDLTYEDFDDLEKQIDALEAGKPGGGAPPSQQTNLRSTSAAKDYAGDPASHSADTLRQPFSGAVTHIAATPDGNSEVTQSPGAPFKPA